jgi:tetratricopeptide (TPR) repeat protein
MSIEAVQADLPIIKKWIDDREYDIAGSALSVYLTDNHDDEQAWFLMGRLMLEKDNPALAMRIFEWTTAKKGSKRWQDWLNLGTAWDTINVADKAEECYMRALELSPDNQSVLVSLGTCYVQQYRSKEAVKTLTKVIEADPDARRARSSLGFAHLQLRHWAQGWDAYEAGYGKLRYRTERQYKGEGLWKGKKNKSQRILVHGEQGIGDQIAGFEPLADLAADTTVVGLECSEKIAPLIQRSFPDIDVHGTLGETDLEWPLLKDITSHTGPFTIHKYYRRKEDDYKGEPYLVADPQRRVQWRALLDSLGTKPKIGIAWSGGIPATHRAARRSPIDRWLPILNQDADFISLEYLDRSDDIAALARRRKVTIHNWPWGTQTQDYDDTAALVAELDLVICVPTSVVHLAGALGVPVWCMVHPTPNIHYCGVGDTLAYYRDVQLFRRESNDEWAKTIGVIAEKLEGWIGARRAA